MTATSSKLQELREKKAQLLARQGELIKGIQTRHPEAYAWLTSHQVDLRNLGQYASKIAAATAVAAGTLTATPALAEQPLPEAHVIETVSREELQGMDEDAKAELVWSRYKPLINFSARKYSLDPKLIFATIMIESGGDAFAIRHEPQINDASYGLGQLLYGTARLIGFKGSAEDLYNPEINIDLIGKYHRRNLDTYGEELTPEQLTTAYNTGNPYGGAYPGHIAKFQRWFRKVGEMMASA